jgi:hypothetical protein
MRAECKHQRVGERPISRSMGILPMSRRAILALPRTGFLHGQDARDTHGRDAHATGRAVSKRYRFVLALSLLLAGAGFGAQPAARPLLPETAVLDRVDGRLLHVDANDTWLFELTMDVKTPDYQLPTGARFVVLPSVTLGRLIADVNERVAPRYRLSARVTRFREKNYLYPTYYLPLSKFKDGQGAEAESPTPPPEIRNPQAGAPELSVPPEILEQLKKQRPLRGPRKGAQTQPKPIPGSERVVADCVGRIESRQEPVVGSPSSVPSGPSPTDDRQLRADNFWAFVPYALGWNLSNVRYELLPSQALEEALQKQARALNPMRFNVAGLVTEFQGKKYLLLQRAAIVYNYGDFGR